MVKRALATLAFMLAAGAGSLAWGAVPALAASCTGASHVMTLTNGTASPGSGPAGSSFTFSVTYTDNAGCAPTAIAVTVDGVGTTDLTASSTTYQSGVVFQRAMTLPAGTWTYRFGATSGSGNGTDSVILTTVSPAAVVVTSPPPPPPPPTPKPTPTPTPRPTPAPTPTPTPTPTSTATPGPTPTETASPAPSTTADASPSGAGPLPSASLVASPRPSDSSLGGIVGAIGGRPGGWRGGGGLGSADLLPDGNGGGSSPLELLMASAVISLGGIALFMGLMAIARRRRAAALAAEVGSSGPPVELSFAETRGLIPAAPPPDTPLEEASIPRWRRPSLRAARQLSERDVPIEHVPIVFRDLVGPGVVRRQVAYRLVRMGTEPDEFSGEEVGRLDRGDEVEILREEQGYCLVRTPLEAVGWVHRTTLRQLDDEQTFEMRLETDA